MLNDKLYNAVTFYIEYGDMGFAQISNFIHKVLARIELNSKEAENIRYKYYNQAEGWQDVQWVKKILNDRMEYKKINEPHKIRNLDNSYRINFLIVFREHTLKDITELQNFYLIKNYFRNASVWGVFWGSSDMYYKVSQYLSGVYDFYPSFYDQLYHRGDNLRRLQKNGTAVSRRIMPLQVINTETIEVLFGKTEDILGMEVLKNIIAGQDMSQISWRFHNQIGGTAKLLGESRHMIHEVSDEELYQLFSQTSVLALVFLAYFMWNAGKQAWKAEELRYCLTQFEEYSYACRQLAENIVFHSTAGEGCLSLRIYSHGEEYLKKKYSLEIPGDSCYFEIEISDYAADNKKGNIAENFASKMKETDMQTLFENSVPADFFGRLFDENEENSVKWKKYYSDSRNIGKHFGLRIFEKVVYQNKGVFMAESHSEHRQKQGEWFSTGGNEHQKTYCMPGTRYSIAFPVGSARSAIFNQERSFESGEKFVKAVNDFWSYLVCDSGRVIPAMQYVNQADKEKYIQSVAAILKQQCENTDCQVMYFSAEDMGKQQGEILAKASIIALYQLADKKHLVFYGCERAMMDEFRIAAEALFYNTGLEEMFYGIYQQIALYDDELEEFVFIPGNRGLSDELNMHLGIMKTAPVLDAGWIPFDIFKSEKGGQYQKSLFEKYTEKVLEEDIQSNKLGCRIRHTHMRLGSTIHIDEFYEAEIIFGSRFFISRFAYLIVQDMKNVIKDVEKITLYGYATYSENLLIEIIKLLRMVKPELDVDFAILEREAEHRGLLHADRIRYGKLFHSEMEKRDYFRDRKIVIIVPINSTLKTHKRMLDLFSAQNAMTDDNSWILKNYALILVGSKAENSYWKLDSDNYYITDNIKPDPRYYVKTAVDYNEALKCKMCFPEKSTAEIPLIEVNAASTIPNQSFGVWSVGAVCNKNALYKEICEEEKMLRPLKECLIYGHICRKESHFLYYFQTEYLLSAEREKIKESLRIWAEDNINKEEAEYNLIVTPLHFSNAGFVELVDDVVFHGACMILRVDFDKEYRSNMYAKYSNIRTLVNILEKSEQKCVLKIHYIDDNIISGKTFYRAKSLIESVLNMYNQESQNVEIRVFDKVFTLIDRNSESSKMQYIRSWNPLGRNKENLKRDFYTYISLSISSLRNYGDSCIGCNLEREAELLYRTSSTKEIADYWSERIKKYALQTLPEQMVDKAGNMSYYKNTEARERAYRRMVCTHIARKILEKNGYINEKQKTVFGILQLVNCDYVNREENQFEYFLSYLKVLSRPFMVFQKSIKEGIFDILLIVIDSMIKEQSIINIVEGVSDQKPYLKGDGLLLEWKILETKIVHTNERTDAEKRDLLLIVMKQLTELKSNYIMRPDIMQEIFGYVYGLSVMRDEKSRKEFQKKYVLMIKRLIGISSDTSKGLWLDLMLHKERILVGVPEEFQQWMILENTRVFRDGIEKFDNLCSQNKELADKLNSYYEKLFLGNEYLALLKRMEEFRENKLESSTEEEVEKFLRKNLQNNMVCTEKTVTYLKNSETGHKMKQIFDYILKKIKAETVSVNWLNEVISLKTCFKKHSDIYQYSNFYTLMEAYGMADADASDFTERGIEVIANCLGIYEICEQVERQDGVENKEEKIALKIHKLAVFMQNILHAYKVQVIMEKSYSSDWWKEYLLDKFNMDIVKKHFPEKEELCLKVKCRKDYMLLADSTTANTIDSAANENVADCLNRFREDDVSNERGYRINKKEGYFIWKIGNMTKHDIFFYAEFNQEREQLELYNDLRNVMMFYNLLQTKLFNMKENSVLYELMVARSELEVYNRNKAHSHTKNDVIQAQYKQALMDENLQKECSEVYRSGVLTLLSDLNVSELYRNSLKPQFYTQKIEYDYKVLWDDQDSVIKSGACYYVTHGVASDLIELKIVTDEVQIDSDEPVKDKERVLCGSDSKRQFFLLLFSIALNAAGRERGKTEDGKIKVFFSKTSDGNLRIMNESQLGNLDIEKINREILIEPEREERGISLWAMSRYIKRMLCRMLEQRIKDWNRNAQTEKISEVQIERYSKILTKALSSEFELKAQSIRVNEKEYFSIEIPVFWEKYQRKLEL